MGLEGVFRFLSLTDHRFASVPGEDYIFEGICGQGCEGAGVGGEFGLSREDAEDGGHVFGFMSLLPVAADFGQVVLEAVGGDVLGEAELSGVASFAVLGQVAR